MIFKNKPIRVSIVLITLLFGGFSCTKKEPLEGKVLNLYLKDNIRTADPAGAYDSVSLEPLPQIYESLYQYDYFKEKRRIVPLLADGMPKFSKDGLTVTIKIKKNVHFHDDPAFPNGLGRELKANDFIYGWKRLAITRVHSEGFWVFDAKVVGYNDFQNQFKNESSEDTIAQADIEGMKALDDYTIELKLTKPYPQLMYVLSMTFTAPMAIEVIKRYGPEIVNRPVGTGPFMAASWQPQSKVILKRNPKFRVELFPAAKDIDEAFKEYRSYAERPLPLVDNLVFRVIKEEQPRYLEMIQGNLAHIEIPKDNSDDVIIPGTREIAEHLAAKGFGLSIEDGTLHWYMFINMEDSLLGKNKYLRQALSSAINRDEWMKIARNGRGVLATEFNPVGIDDRCGRKALKYDYSLEKAKQLLAKAGYPNGEGLPAINFDLRGANTANRQIGEFVSKNLSAVGIKINVILNTFPAFLDKRQNKNLQLAYGGWQMDYPDAENFMQLLYGPNEAPGPNESNFKNENYDRLYQKMVISSSGATRKNMICQMEEILQDETPVILGFYESLYRLVGPNVHNFHNYEQAQNKYKYIDQTTEPVQAKR